MAHIGVVVHGPHDEAALRAALVHALLGEAEVHRFGTASASVYVAIPPSQYPPVELVSRGDGSFCLVDGELHSRKVDGVHGSGVDAKVILDDFLTRGDEALADLDAGAAITLFDSYAGRLVVARDTLGIGAAFYEVSDGAMRWSSSLSALRRLSGRTQLHREAFDFYIATGYVQAPWTLTEGITRLGPGELASWTNGEHDQRRYHQLSYVANGNPVSERYEVLARELPRAVAHRITAPERTGVLLSSGIDSMLLLALASKEMHGAPPSFTFTYEMYDGHLNEAAEARRVAKLLGSEHHEIRVDPLQVIERLPMLFDAFGEPFGFGLHSVMLGGIVERGSTDLLSGGGADSLYVPGQARNAVRFSEMPRIAQSAIRTGSKTLRAIDMAYQRRFPGREIPVLARLGRSAHGAAWTSDTARTFSTSDWALRYPLRKDLYVDHDFAPRGRRAKRALFEAERSHYDGESPDGTFRLMEMRTFDADAMFHWNLACSRANGATIRTPFAARTLIDSWNKYDATTSGKPDVRRLAAEILPAEVVDAPKTHQGAPIQEWLRGPLRPWLAEALDREQLIADGIFDPDAVERLVASHMSGKVKLGWILWMMASATMWLDHVRND